MNTGEFLARIYLSVITLLMGLAIGYMVGDRGKPGDKALLSWAPLAACVWLVGFPVLVVIARYHGWIG